MKKSSRFLSSLVLISVFFMSCSFLTSKAIDDSIYPIARSGHNMIYSPIDDEIILFGGMKDNFNVEGSYLDDTWIYSYSTNTWTELLTSTQPSNRTSPGMVYDPTKERVLFFGGLSHNEYFNDTWELDLDTYEWNKIETEISPPILAEAEMVFDDFNQEIILFGGHVPTGYFDETWIFNITDDTWTKLNLSTHPSSRYGHRMVYSYSKEAVVLFGGHAFNTSDTVNNDMWIYNCSSRLWIEMVIDSPPPIRYWHDIAYDEVNEKIVLFGGRINWYTMDCRNDTWEFDEETNQWVEIETEQSPEARMWFSMVYNEKEGNIILFGGNQDPNTKIFGDLWEYNTERSQWKQIDLSKRVSNFPVIGVVTILSLLGLTSMNRKKSETRI